MEGIEIFVEVVDAQSFTRAAKRLAMPNTTVSAKIARLEERLGVTLLRRTTRKLSLTEAGERYYAHCAKALAIMAEASESLCSDADEPSGTLRVTAAADLTQSLLTPIIQRYLEQFPKMSIDLVMSNQFVDLIAHKVDLAIRIGEITESNLIIRKFVTGRLSLWASPSYLEAAGHPKDVADLETHHLVWLKSVSQNMHRSELIGSLPHIPSPPRLLVDDLQTCQALVEKGLGIGLLPEFDHERFVMSDKLERVLPGVHSLPYTAMLAYPKQKFVPLKVRRFIDTATSILRRR